MGGTCLWLLRREVGPSIKDAKLVKQSTLLPRASLKSLYALVTILNFFNVDQVSCCRLMSSWIGYFTKLEVSNRKTKVERELKTEAIKLIGEWGIAQD